MLLQFIKSFSLLFNHISMSEREVAHSLNRLETLFIFFSLLFFVLENLVSHDESVGFVSLVLSLIHKLFLHELFLHIKQALLVFTLLDLVKQLSVTLFVNLVNDLAKHVIIVASIEVYSLAKAVTHFAINEGWHERVWKRLPCTHVQ